MPSSGSLFSGERKPSLGLLLYTHTSPSWYSKAQRSPTVSMASPLHRALGKAPKGAVPHFRLTLFPQLLADYPLAPEPTGKDTCGALDDQPRAPQG